MHLNHCVFWLSKMKRPTRTNPFETVNGNCLFLFTQWFSSVLLDVVQLSASDFIYGYQPGLPREHGLNWELIQSAVYGALNWNLKCTDTGLSGGFKRNFAATNIKASTHC